MTLESTPRWRRTARRWAHRARVLEAMVLLALAAFGQRFVPMQRWSALFGRPAAVPPQWRGERIEALPLRWASPSERKVVEAVRSAARLVPWTPRCLPEAVAGQVMLRQFGSPGVVVIGLRPGEVGAGEATGAPWVAHAWLLGHQGALTGGSAARGFTATTVFEVPGGLSAGDVALGPVQPPSG